MEKQRRSEWSPRRVEVLFLNGYLNSLFENIHPERMGELKTALENSIVPKEVYEHRFGTVETED